MTSSVFLFLSYHTSCYVSLNSIPHCLLFPMFRFLITAPLPRAVTGCGEMTNLIMNSVQYLQRIVKKLNELQLPSYSHNTDKKNSTPRNAQNFTKFSIPKDISCWTNSVSRRTPVFVINLDRRSDR